MKHDVAKVLIAIGVAGAVIVFFWSIEDGNYNWGALLSVPISLASLLLIDKSSLGRSKNKEIIEPPKPPVQWDIDLFQQFIDLLSPEGNRFYKEHDFLNSFTRQDRLPLLLFVGGWDTPKFEFFDEDLEEARQKFYNWAEQLNEKLSLYTRPDGIDTFTVRNNRDEVGPISKQDLGQAKELNELATRFAQEYDEFYRYGTRRIHAPGTIDPPQGG